MAETLLEDVLSFIYTIGHWIGQSTDIFLAIAEVAKKAIWIVATFG